MRGFCRVAWGVLAGTLVLFGFGQLWAPAQAPAAAIWRGVGRAGDDPHTRGFLVCRLCERRLIRATLDRGVLALARAAALRARAAWRPASRWGWIPGAVLPPPDRGHTRGEARRSLGQPKRRKRSLAAQCTAGSAPDLNVAFGVPTNGWAAATTGRWPPDGKAEAPEWLPRLTVWRPQLDACRALPLCHLGFARREQLSFSRRIPTRVGVGRRARAGDRLRHLIARPRPLDCVRVAPANHRRSASSWLTLEPWHYELHSPPMTLRRIRQPPASARARSYTVLPDCPPDKPEDTDDRMQTSFALDRASHGYAVRLLLVPSEVCLRSSERPPWRRRSQ